MPADGFLKRLLGPRAATAPPENAPEVVGALFWLLLSRAPGEAEAREASRAIGSGQSAEVLVTRLISSPEFRLLHEARREGGTGGRDERSLEAGLSGLGDARAFVERCYLVVLGREADEGGRDYYVSRLADGGARADVLRALLQSDEFDERFTRICPQAGAIPRDVQLCELANPAKWDNPDWMKILRSLGEPADKISMHRKTYEFTQMLFGLERLGMLRPDATVVSVGAGHEKPLYWLANRVARVVATDMYEGEWQSSGAMEGDAHVIARPEDYAPFPYPAERLVFLKMDGRRLAFRDGTFDIAYSLSSIEHFGGVEAAWQAMDEMARVLRPGGIVAVATEYCLSGPPHHEAFQPDEVRAILDRPRLRLVQPVDERVHARYDVVPVDLWQNRYQTPHMAVKDRDTVFTSVMAFLEKV